MWLRPERGGCFICGQTDHFAKECKAGDRCHNCQEDGHKAAQCPKPQRCRRCAREGHKEFECDAPVGGGSCHNCGKVGHFVKNCPEPPLCHNCQRPGHKGSECTAPPVCKRCKNPGHISTECKLKRGEVCPFYAAGSCKKGLQCDYEHIGAPGYASHGPPGHHFGGGFGPTANIPPLVNGEEMRKDTDGRRYSKAEYKKLYGGYAEWDRQEERMSLSNGRWYTKQQFKEHFGGYDEWDRALSLQSVLAISNGVMGGQGFHGLPAGGKGFMGGKGFKGRPVSRGRGRY